MVVMADVPREDPLSERCRRHDEVRRCLSQRTTVRPPVLVQRSEAFDSTGVENDDQPAALFDPSPERADG